MKTTTLQVASKKVLLLVVIIGVALLFSTAINGIPSAAALDQIHLSREVSAPLGKVWNTITNLGYDTAWNQVDSMKVTKKTGNIIEEDIKIGPPSVGHEITISHPKQSVVVTNITNGPVKGSRVVTLSPLPENKTKVDVLWSVDTSGVPFFAKGFVMDGFTKKQIIQLEEQIF